MGRINILIVLLLGLAFSAQAETFSETATGEIVVQDQPEGVLTKASVLNQQAAQGEFVLELSPQYLQRSWSYSEVGFGFDRTEKTYSEKVMGISGELGAGKNTSLKLATSYGMGKTTVSTHADNDYRFSGFSDLALSVKLRSAEGLFFSLTGYLSPETQVQATRQTTGNRSSGGNAIEPKLSLEGKVAPNFILGMFTSYVIRGERNTEARDKRGNVTFKESMIGGNTFSLGALSEYQKASFSVGLSAALVAVESTSFDGDDGRFVGDPRNYLQSTLYGSIHSTSSMDVIPSITYERLLTTEVDGLVYDSSNEMTVNLAARFTL